MIELHTYLLILAIIALTAYHISIRTVRIAAAVKSTSEFWQNKIKEINEKSSERIENLVNLNSSNLLRQASVMREERDNAIKALSQKHHKAIEEARKSSRRQTKAVRFGNAAQHSLLPLLAAQEEGIDPRDIRWLGGVFDFVVFKNLHRSEDVPVEIIFADAKTSVRISSIINSKDKVGKYKKYDPAYTFFSIDQTRVAQAIERGDISYQLWMADSNTEEFQVRTYSSDSPSRHFGNYKKEKENDASEKKDSGKPV